MRKTAIIIHGAPNADEVYDGRVPSPSNHHWLPWLQKQLLVRGYEAHTPEIPNPHEPHYPTWKREFERYENKRRKYSRGAQLRRWIFGALALRSPHVAVGKVALVAPWIDLERSRTTEFFNFHLDPEFPTRTKGTALFNSDNDGPNIHSSVAQIMKTVHYIQYREFHNYGHFCVEDTGTNEFPELLEFITS